MNHLFVPEKESLELKTLGFDEPCLGLYPLAPKELIYKILPNQFEAKEYFGGVLAPLYSQVFDWFREKHSLLSRIVYINSVYRFQYQYLSSAISTYMTKYNTYEEAQLACLQNLIKMYKNDNTTRS